jgi:NAD(P)-dependent dehydrogenase (short-subunit alcohol dehydrogenase family)
MRETRDKKSSTDPQLVGRVAIITGAGHGIGEAIAHAFAYENAKSILVARTESDVSRVSNEIKNSGGHATPIVGDVSNPNDVARIMHTAIEQYGAIDILVNAAAIHGPIRRLWEADIDSWIMAMQVNLIGTFLCCHAAIPCMISNSAGKIINFSGGGATSPSPYLSAYGVSKAAIVRLTETLAVELADQNIQVNAIAPGMVDTQIHDDILALGNAIPEIAAPIRRLRESGQGGVPKELPAQLAVFLASSASDGLSGKLIAAPHDDWRTWDRTRIADLMSKPWLTLRRVDSHTLKPLLNSSESGPCRG